MPGKHTRGHRSRCVTYGKRKRRQNSRKSRRLRAEPLERREMLSAVSISMSGETLYIRGTGGNDKVEVDYVDASGDQIQVEVDDTVKKPFTGVKLIKFYGGDGNDYFMNYTIVPVKAYGQNGNDTLWGDKGNDSLYGGNNDDHLYGWSGNDKLYGQSGNDRLYGQSGNDTIHGYKGHDTIYGGSGNDLLKGSYDNDKLYGDEGNDTIYGNSGNDYLKGGDDPDTLYGSSGNDTLNGEGGNDSLSGSLGNDTIRGGNGNDTIYGSSGHDYLSGGDNSDSIYGGSGNDTLYGGKHDDYLSGSSNNDTIYANDGNDTVYGNSGSDKLSGGQGNDRLEGGSSRDSLWGSDGDDTLRGDGGDDYVDGGAGNDELSGNDGNDSLYGGGGYDSLYGGKGFDHYHQELSSTASSWYPTTFEAGRPAVWAYEGYVSPAYYDNAMADFKDVKQADTGTCYLLASLSSVARSKGLYSDLANRIKYLGNNKYQITLYNPIIGYNHTFDRWEVSRWQTKTQTVTFNGHWDDNDAWPELNTFDFWPVLYQRAYLAEFGGIDGGNPGLALMRLTGIRNDGMYTDSGVTTYGRVTPKSGKETIRNALNLNKAVVASTPGSKKKKGALDPDGHIFGGHAYSVLEMYDKPGGTTMLVLRNPWKSDGDTVQTDPDGIQRDDGIFRITYDDFTKYFYRCYVNRGYDV